MDNLNKVSFKHSSIFLILPIIFAITFTPSVYAKIYKWVDENGKVHYSDKPFNNKGNEVKIKDPKGSTADRATKDRMDRIKSRAKAGLEIQKEQQAIAQEKEKKQKKAKVACAEIQKQINTLNMPIRIGEADIDGNIKFISEEERAANLKKLKNAQKEFCT